VGSSNITARAEGTSSTAGAVTVGAGAQPPSTAEVQATASSTFTPGCVVIGAGGSVTWQFGALGHNVIFGTNKPTGGDIAERANTSESRTFPTAGDFPYTCTIHPGMNGRVIVR
jgi:plastocyanin